MRISATVEVSNRSVPSLNVSKRRPEKSYLTIGFVSNRKDKIFILHQTMSNTVGVKYKVSGNVSSILDRFSNEGKFSIRFIEPTIDLIIKGEPASVKKFLKILKSSLNLKPMNIPNLSNLMAAPTKVVSEPTTKLVVKGKMKLPDFPRSLKHLEITDCTLTKFPIGILRLQHVRVLNLKNNDIEDIPNQIELLPCLEELILENNKLGTKSTFSWLNCDSLQDKLELLDLRKNELKFIPRGLLNLKKLKSLFLDYNELKILPSALGKLHSTLRTLTFSHNKISILPGSFMKLRLSYLDFSGNPFCNDPEKVMSCRLDTPRVLSLVEIAGKTVLHKRLKYDEKTLPRTLIDFLDTAGNCVCGCPGFRGLKITLRINRNLLNMICQEYKSSIDSPLPIISFLICSTSGCNRSNMLIDALIVND